MAVTRSLFRNVSAHATEPHHIVRALNEAMSEGNESSMFVTLFVGVLELETGLLHYCNAGHDAPLLIASGSCQELPCEPNIPVGIMPGWEFAPQVAQLQPDTTVFLYTDGLNEAENAGHEGDPRHTDGTSCSRLRWRCRTERRPHHVSHPLLAWQMSEERIIFIIRKNRNLCIGNLCMPSWP